MSKLYLQHDYKVTGRDYVETEGGDTPAGGIDYSTEEQDTGLKWIDGKSIFQRSFDFDEVLSVSYNSWTNTDIDATNMETIISATAIGSTGTYNGDLYAGAGDGHAKVVLQTPRNGGTASVKVLTIRYTKITE